MPKSPVTQTKVGAATWFDLPAANMADAMVFYEDLLSWQFVRLEGRLESDYVMIRAGGTLIGGLRRVEAKTLDKGWDSAPILYFTVAELTPKVARAKQLGALLVGEEVDLGRGRGRYQWIKDREHNLVGLWGAA